MHKQRGRIEIICGSMFSGKTERLVGRLLRAQKYAKKSVMAFKHASDTRYHETHLGGHGGSLFLATPAATSSVLLAAVPLTVDVVGIDEGQFFDDGLPAVCQELADRGVRVIVAGLDQDSDTNPFPPMPALMAIAESVKKVHAVCVLCGDEASRSYYLGHKEGVVLVGGAERYEARCRTCFHRGDNV